MLSKLHLGVNPIIVKELRSRMRDARAFITLTLALLVLGGSSYLLYRIMATTASYSYMPMSPQIGQSLFVSLTLLMLLMVAAVAPAVTAGSISGEQEKLTYEMLMATPLKASSILWGKLMSALSYVFLLIFAAIPMASLIFIFGGVAIRDMLKALIILLVVAIMFGMIGLFMSAWLGRTGRATVVSYLLVLALFVVPIIAYAATGILRMAEPPRWILVVNPVSALFSAITTSSPIDGPASGFLWGLGMSLGGNLRLLTGMDVSQTGIPRPLYHYSLPVFALFTFILYGLSTRLIMPTQRWKLKWREIIIFLLSLALIVGLTVLAFLLTANMYERGSIFTAPPPFGQGMPGPEPMAVERAIAVPNQAPDGRTVPLEVEPVGIVEPAGEIYAAIAFELYTVDHPYGVQANPPNFPVLYLARYTDSGIGDPKAPYTGTYELPDYVQIEVTTALASTAPGSLHSVPAEILWIKGLEEAPLDPKTGEVAKGGAVITLGHIFFQDDGTAMVSASIFVSKQAALGKTYVLEEIDDRWQVIGDTGRQWNQ